MISVIRSPTSVIRSPRRHSLKVCSNGAHVAVFYTGRARRDHSERVRRPAVAPANRRSTYDRRTLWRVLMECGETKGTQTDTPFTLAAESLHVGPRPFP
jgi:hypothetical protein